MSTDLSSAQITKFISLFLHRYHVILFTIFILGGLSVATFLLYTASSPGPGEQAVNKSTKFDQTTINQINNLRSPTEQPQSLKLPSGRINPLQG